VGVSPATIGRFLKEVALKEMKKIYIEILRKYRDFRVLWSLFVLM